MTATQITGSSGTGGGNRVLISQINLRDADLAMAPALPGNRWDLSKRQNWNTPRILMALAGAVLLAAAWLFFAITGATSECRGAVKSIGKDCAPSIVAAQKIAAALADFDANETNELICEPKSKDMETAEDIARQRHTEITSGLVAAAENITFGDNERGPIKTMADNLGKYETTMEEAKILLQSGRKDDAIKAGRTASGLMHAVLLPAADTLDGANRTVMDSTFESHQKMTMLHFGSMLLAGGVLLTALGYAQYYTFRKTNRLLNPGMATASVITVILAGYTMSTISATNGILRSAMRDAFDSVHFLWHARAISYDANGEETRWLFDRDNAKRYADAFFAKSMSLGAYQSRPLTELPPGINATILAEMAGRKDYMAAEFKGYLADELKNITFPGELEAATETLGNYIDYLKADKKIRQLEEDGHHAEAIRFCLSYEKGGSNYLFGKFDDALGRTLDINQKAFDEDIESSFQHLGPLAYIPAIAILLIAASAIFGFWQRLKEYHV